jgi:chromosome partitioning protein
MATSVITIANQKGGVGKTTATVNLAASYAHHNKRVLVVDMDYQTNASEQLGVVEEAGSSGRNIAQAIMKDLKIDQIRLPSNTEGIDVLASVRSLENVIANRQGSPAQHLLLNKMFDCEAYHDYDIILIDTHPSLDCSLLSALVSSHYYLVPMFPERSASQGLAQMIKYVREMRDLNPTLMLLGIVISKYDRSSATHVRFEQLIREGGKSANYRVFETLIPASVSVSGADAAGKVLLNYKRTAPVTVAYTLLAGEILPYLKGRRTGRISVPDATAVDAISREIEFMPDLAFE